METGEIIYRLLKERDKKQADLARYLGVNPNTVNRWIPTKNKSGIEPSDYHKIRIAEFFDVPIGYITGEYDYFSDHSIIEHLFDSTAKESAWIRLLNTLGYAIRDCTDYSTDNAKQVEITYKSKTRIMSHAEFSLYLKKFESHIAVEMEA